MSLLAQLPARPVLPRLDQDASVFLFSCEREEEDCEFWELEDGANAVVTVSRDELSEGQTEAPESTPVLVETWVHGWSEHEDGVDPDQEVVHYDESDIWELPESAQFPYQFESRFNTKAGGVPSWTGNGPGPIDPEWRVLFQLGQIPLPDDDPDRVSALVAGDPIAQYASTPRMPQHANMALDGIFFLLDLTPEEPEATLGLLLNS